MKYLVPLLLLFTACGDGNNDSVFTGFSGVILGIFLFILIVVGIRMALKRSK